ncbi:hypothetical protein JAAARDRAFT_175161 [Jaapia argillacea MUCL 33604]|uniref:Rhamnose mutarotase n=1 Tax=Jaapia argillacea MUCL 33604 TaxID=933084 RepID=A0A067PY94_9AGAM|nr:hypothetical protein JAAARDRAFT_175161 [Jaapia argillacea MUCL 33604]
MPATQSDQTQRRICQVIKLKPEAEAEYKAIHANVWPGVLACLERHHITDYSIHYFPLLHLLIANFKYTGDDFEADMRGIGQDEVTRKWWKVTDAMQESFQEGAVGSGGEVPWWTDLEEVFRFEGKP